MHQKRLLGFYEYFIIFFEKTKFSDNFECVRGCIIGKIILVINSLFSCLLYTLGVFSYISKKERESNQKKGFSTCAQRFVKNVVGAYNFDRAHKQKQERDALPRPTFTLLLELKLNIIEPYMFSRFLCLTRQKLLVLYTIEANRNKCCAL